MSQLILNRPHPGNKMLCEDVGIREALTNDLLFSATICSDRRSCIALLTLQALSHKLLAGTVLTIKTSVFFLCIGY
jgi:hypothetical protein